MFFVLEPLPLIFLFVVVGEDACALAEVAFEFSCVCAQVVVIVCSCTVSGTRFELALVFLTVGVEQNSETVGGVLSEISHVGGAILKFEDASSLFHGV